MQKLADRCLNFLSSKTFLYITLIWFVLQAVYFATTIKFGLPPDENYHFTYIKYFSGILPSPFPGPQHGYDILLDAVHNPFFLYHYLLSFPYKLVSGFSDAYMFIRLINVMLGVGSLLLVVKIANLAKISALARNLSIFMLVNTLMFTFIFSSISYDNMFIFLSLASILLLLKLLKKVSASTLLLFLAVLAAGMLTKINFLPIAFIIFLIFIIRYFKHFKKLSSSFKKTFKDSLKLNVFLLVLLSLLSILFIQRYVYNEFKYGSYNPVCTKTRTLAECRGSDLFVRNEMIYSAHHPKAKENIVQYSKDWVPLIENRTFGIFGHKEFKANKLINIWATLILILGSIIVIAKWRKINKSIKVLIYITLFYSVALFIENIHNYHASGRLGFAVHGRYLFCILPIIYLVINNSIIEKIKSKPLVLTYALLTVVIFAATALPVFLSSTTPDWFR